MEIPPRVDDLLALPDGRSLAYAEFGDPDGRPVLFFHATPGVRLIAPDRPGVGRSTPQPHRRLLDWPDDVRHLADALGLERFAVVGFSNGGAARRRLRVQARPTGQRHGAGRPDAAPRPARSAAAAGAPGWYYPLARRAP